MNLRPDVAYNVNQSMREVDSNLNLEDEQRGFHCKECDWREMTIPLPNSPGEPHETKCPECGSKNVANLLTENIEEVKKTWSQCKNPDDNWVNYRTLGMEFDGPGVAFDTALNHLLARDDAYVVFERGYAMVSIVG